MPGFNISELADTGSQRHIPKGDLRGETNGGFLYNYFWEVPVLFDTAAAQEKPLIYLKDISLPNVNIAKETYTGASLEYKFASNVTYDDLNFSFYDTVGLLPYIREWRRSIWTQTGGVKTSNNYKKYTRIKVYSPDMDDPVQGYVFAGSWPSVIKYGNLTYTSSDLKYVELTITYDWMEELDILEAVDINSYNVENAE